MGMEQEKSYIQVDEALAASWLPRRPWDGHKGTFGKVCAIGGSVGLTGAPVLAAMAAARTGSGLVYLGVPKEIYPITASMCLEAMPFPLPDGEGRLVLEAMEPVLERFQACDAGLLGPGLGRAAGVSELVCGLLKRSSLPLVLDADALYAIKDQKELLKARGEQGLITILTPHEGEFAYLGGSLPKSQMSEKPEWEVRRERMRERIKAAKDFAAEYKCVLVLKGPDTVTADPEGNVFVNTTGNSGMAKGGSGDVLSGMVLSLLGQGLEPVKAAALAVWLHGYAGDLCKKKLGEFGMLPRDLIERIPEAFTGLSSTC